MHGSKLRAGDWAAVILHEVEVQGLPLGLSDTHTKHIFGSFVWISPARREGLEWNEALLEVSVSGARSDCHGIMDCITFGLLHFAPPSRTIDITSYLMTFISYPGFHSTSIGDDENTCLSML